jgi:hypothetical protein
VVALSRARTGRGAGDGKELVEVLDEEGDHLALSLS